MTPPRGELHIQHPLAEYTSWGVGGPAARFYRPADLADLSLFLQTLPENEPLTWLGLGSNVLIRDGGVLGTTLLTLGRLDRLELLENGLVYAEAGVTCAKLAKFCTKNDFGAGAFFAGIPGTVGGALAMNAGAYGGETWPQVEAVDIMNAHGEILQRHASEFKIAYREVQGLAKGEAFVAGYFKFPHGVSAEAQQQIKALMAKRNATQPIGLRSCGSVFRNPPGDFAARLIESAKLKGFCIGGAEVSEKHANFIINGGAASAADIEQLIQTVQSRVRDVHGVQLIPEVHILGVPLNHESSQ